MRVEGDLPFRTYILYQLARALKSGAVATNVPSIEEVQGESAKKAASDVAVPHKAGLFEVSKPILLREPPDSADQLGAVHTLFLKVDKADGREPQATDVFAASTQGQRYQIIGTEFEA